MSGSSSRPAWGARLLLVLIIIVGTIHAVFMIGVELLRWSETETEINRLEVDVRELEREANQLRSITENGDDRSFRIQLARQQGHMFPDEARIITIPDSVPPPEEPESPAAP